MRAGLRRRGMTAGVGVTVCVGIIAAWAGPLHSAAGPESGRGSGAEVARSGEARATAVLGAVAERPAEPEADASPAVADAPIIEAPAAFDGPQAVARPVRPLGAMAPARAGGEGGTWALVVGINDYPGDSHDLLFAVNDADDVDAALSRYGVGADRRLVLRDGQATSGAIRAGLAWLVERAGNDSLAVVSFAGHAREREGDRQAFVAADGVELADRELATALRPLRSGKAWLNFGTCYAGGFDELLAPGRLLTGAAPAGKLAYESTAIGRSYLGEYMVRRGLLASGADGDVGRAFVAGRDAVARDHPDRVPVAITGPGPVAINLRSAATAPPTASSQSPTPSEPAAPGASAGNGSNPSPSGPPPPSQPETAEQPAPRRDDCADLTLGAVSCG